MVLEDCFFCKPTNVKPKKVFDIAISEHSPHWYDDSFEQVYLEEDYCPSKTIEERQRIMAHYITFWDGFKKYLHDRDVTTFDDSINKIKDMDFSNCEYPSVYATFKGKNGYEVKVKLSAYTRLFAEIDIGKLPKYGKRSIAVTKHYLYRYIKEWENRSIESIGRGYGKNIHLFEKDGILYFCTAFKEHDDGGDFANLDNKYKWLYRMIKIASDLANEKYHDFDTYSPAEYKLFLDNLALKGRTITNIFDNNFVLDYYSERHRVEMDGRFTFALDDGRTIGFMFERASHPSIDLLDEWDLPGTIFKDGRPEWRNSEIFNELVGKKIKRVNVVSSKDVDDLLDAYWDEDFDEHQEEFIVRLEFILNDGNILTIEPGIDWTDVLIKNS